MTEKEMKFNLLEDGGDDANILQEVKLDDIKVEVGVAVCFHPVNGEPTTVRIVGGSAEKVEKRNRRASKDMWDDDNAAGVNDVQKGGVGKEELFGA